jgi:sucrose phosphorylase
VRRAPPAERALSLLEFIYGPERAAAVKPRFDRLLEEFARRQPGRGSRPRSRFDERDAVLIAYGDQVTAPGQTPLRALGEVFGSLVGAVIPGLHVLPFYPSTSDDGFSVADYFSVDPGLGTWEDVRALAGRFWLMCDHVLNHVSASSAWFRGFLEDRPGDSDRFIALDPATDLSAVVRPRTHPLLTPFDTAAGRKQVWTTFSADQVDLNYAHPAVLLDSLAALLHYVENGARVIRLDAVAFLWKEPGTPCIHHPRTHAIVKLLRAALDTVAPDVALITETNVPHDENVSYFGADGDEAQLVYQFPLAPLVLDGFYNGDARVLTEWVSRLPAPDPDALFFNFLASHDGIGVRPAEGLLSEERLAGLVERVTALGGFVNSRSGPDGRARPYELNITLYDALALSDAGDPEATGIRRFLTAHALMLALAGVPGIYVHSLFGSSGDHPAALATGQNRRVNRRKFTRDEIERILADPAGRPAQVLAGLKGLLTARAATPALAPASGQAALDLGPGLLALLRGPDSRGRQVVAVHNLTGEPAEFTLAPSFRGGPIIAASGGEAAPPGVVEGWGFRWIRSP